MIVGSLYKVVDWPYRLNEMKDTHIGSKLMLMRKEPSSIGGSMYYLEFLLIPEIRLAQSDYWTKTNFERLFKRIK
jgi:hypothetical protein